MNLKQGVMVVSIAALSVFLPPHDPDMEAMPLCRPEPAPVVIYASGALGHCDFIGLYPYPSGVF